MANPSRKKRKRKASVVGAVLKLLFLLLLLSMLAAFCAAGAVQAALRPLFAAAEAFAGKLLLGPVRLAARCIAPWKAARTAAKVRRNEKRLAKKQKKSLPTPRRMLYNSNVSK